MNKILITFFIRALCLPGLLLIIQNKLHATERNVIGAIRTAVDFPSNFIKSTSGKKNSLVFSKGSRQEFYLLPMQLLNWDVVMISRQVHATWKVSNDVNIARYEIEKSLSGAGFNLLKAVSPMRSPGNTTYGVIDRMPVKGWNYYRLKITDDQGKISYTSIKKIFIKEEPNWAAYPKTNDFVKVSNLNPDISTTGLMLLTATSGVKNKEIL